MRASPQLLPKLEPEITYDQYVRILPGNYLGLCKSAKVYRDKNYKRWVCLLRWDIIQSSSCFEPIARGVPLFLNLGAQGKPHAGRRSRYFSEWIRANSGPPARGDRLSPTVFTRRVARVEISDTDSQAPYSVVRQILAWETGAKKSLSQSVTQSRTARGNRL